MGNVNSIGTNFIDSEIDRVFNSYHSEHSKGNAARHDKMYNTALKLMQLLLRQSHRADNHHVNHLTELLESNVQKVKGTYNPWDGLLINWLTIGVQLAAGGAGLGSLAYAGNAAMQATLKTVTDGGSVVAQGLSGIGKIRDEKSAGQRTQYQHAVDESRKVRDERDRIIQQNEQRMKDALRDLKDASSANHQAIGELLR